jgi:Tol biopolymer transport system component
MSLYVMPLPIQDVTSNPNSPTVEQEALAPYKKASRLLTQQYVSQPVWSPDGKQIAYLSYTNNEFNIWLATVTHNSKSGVYTIQGNPVQLTSGGIDGDSRPFWTP